MSQSGDARDRITLRKLADSLGVSTATVSLALRDAPVVAAKTREAVREAARELGYVYNRSAASLRTARTNMVAVGFNDIVNPYFGELLAAIEATLAGSGRTILLGTYSDDPDKQDRVLGTLKEYRPDGLIVCPADRASALSLTSMAEAGVPVVQISREIADIGLDFVGSDDAAGTRLALEHLIGLGHRRIALIGGTDGMSTGRNRRGAWRRIVASHGLDTDEALLVPGLGTRELGFAAIACLFDQPNPPTALVAFNDLIAFGAILGLRARGLEAGRDVSVVGCDDVKEAALWAPGLTTVANHQDEMGKRAAERILARIVNPRLAAERILIAPTLVVRGTTSRVAT